MFLSVIWEEYHEIWGKRGLGWGKELQGCLSNGAPCKHRQATMQHHHCTHGLSIPSCKSHITSTGVPVSRLLGVFNMTFSSGAKSELFYLPLSVGPKRCLEGTWAGTCGAASSPWTQAWCHPHHQHPLGLTDPQRADGAEPLEQCTAPTQPAADLNWATPSWRQTQADNETRLIGAQNCYWRRSLSLSLFPS